MFVSANHAIQVVGVTASPASPNIMLKFFEQYSSSREDAATGMKQWLAFCGQIDGFRPDAPCWRWINDEEFFWPCCQQFAPQLVILALQVSKISGNSMLAERDWFIINLIKTKTRNQLGNVNVDKLM